MNPLLRGLLIFGLAAGLSIGCTPSGGDGEGETVDTGSASDTPVGDTGEPGSETGGDDAAGDAAADGTDDATADADSFEGWASAAAVGSGPRQEHDTVVLNSKLYLIGGYDDGGNMVASVDVYDPAADSWESAAPFPERLHHVNAAVVDGSIYVVGYLVSGFQEKGKVYSYDPSADEWTERTSMLTGRERGASAVGVIGGKIYVAGGLHKTSAVQMFSVYDPQADSWSKLPDVPRPVDHAAAGVIDGKLVVAGGRNSAIDAHTDAVDIYDPESESWSSGTAMPTSRGGVAAATAQGHLIVIGGEGNSEDPSGVFPQVEAYELSSDSWKTLPEMENPRHGMDAAVVDDVLYVPGGGDTRAFGAVDTHSKLDLSGRF